MQQAMTEVTQIPVVQQSPMTIIAAAVDKGIGADELGKLMDLQDRYEANQARRAFTSAMADFQARCPTILKSKRADRYNYAPLDEILRTIRPHLEQCGLSVRFNTSTDGSTIKAVCHISHRDGHTETSEFSAPVDPAMKVNDTQKAGSANSYAKRYALCNALNLVGSEFDDDGYASAKPTNPDDEPATDEQLATIREYRQENQIPEVTLVWLQKQDSLTVKQAATLITKLKKANAG